MTYVVCGEPINQTHDAILRASRGDVLAKVDAGGKILDVRDRGELA
ncbi:MAG: hypothetical protein ABJP33_04265 [Pseudoruegeria sp.]